jgi:hypothetical protein
MRIARYRMDADPAKRESPLRSKRKSLEDGFPMPSRLGPTNQRRRVARALKAVLSQRRLAIHAAVIAGAPLLFCGAQLQVRAPGGAPRCRTKCSKMPISAARTASTPAASVTLPARAARMRANCGPARPRRPPGRDRLRPRRVVCKSLALAVGCLGCRLKLVAQFAPFGCQQFTSQVVVLDALKALAGGGSLLLGRLRAGRRPRRSCARSRRSSERASAQRRRRHGGRLVDGGVDQAHAPSASLYHSRAEGRITLVSRIAAHPPA